MRDRLGGSNDGGIANRVVLRPFHRTFGFFDDLANGVAFPALGWSPNEREQLFQSLDMALCVSDVRSKGGRERLRRGFLGHLGVRLRYMFFGVVDVPQRVFEKLLKRIHGTQPICCFYSSSRRLTLHLLMSLRCGIQGTTRMARITGCAKASRKRPEPF